MGHYDGVTHQLEHMLSGILGDEPQRSSRRSSDVSKIMHVLAKTVSPREKISDVKLCFTRWK